MHIKQARSGSVFPPSPQPHLARACRLPVALAGHHRGLQELQGADGDRGLLAQAEHRR